MAEQRTPVPKVADSISVILNGTYGPMDKAPVFGTGDFGFDPQ